MAISPYHPIQHPATLVSYQVTTAGFPSLPFSVPADSRSCNRDPYTTKFIIQRRRFEQTAATLESETEAPDP